MSKELVFFIYLIEAYASEHRGTTADKVLSEWNELGLTDFFFDMYERYHSEAIENAFDDIDRHVAAARA